MKKIRRVLAFALSLSVAAGVSACQSSDNSSGAAEESKTYVDESGKEQEVKTIRVGTGNSYNPACYLDDNGEIAGYDYEVLKAVDELLPQYKFEYQTFDFQNVLLSLDSGKIDLAAH